MKHYIQQSAWSVAASDGVAAATEHMKLCRRADMRSLYTFFNINNYYYYYRVTSPWPCDVFFFLSGIDTAFGLNFGHGVTARFSHPTKTDTVCRSSSSGSIYSKISSLRSEKHGLSPVEASLSSENVHLLFVSNLPKGRFSLSFSVKLFVKTYICFLCLIHSKKGLH